MHFNDSIIIGKRVISENEPTFIIAEAGVNHNGDLSIAKKLIDCACSAGVDAVKFQMFKTEDLILERTDKAPYQMKTTGTVQTQYEMLKSLELKEEEFKLIRDYCELKNILFLCTPFEKKSLDKLDSLGVNAFKIAATDLTNISFLRKVAKKGKPILLSAGMCYLDEIRMALEAIYPINKDVILMQCTSNYPLADNEVNLNVIDTLKHEFDVIVGFSDHSKGVGASPYAVAKGVKVVEKHFTLDREMKGPDHKASIEPSQLEELVGTIRRVEEYMGTGNKIPTFSEQYNRKALQKCLVANTVINKGDIFSEDNITAKRTGGEGISALYYDMVLGRVSQRLFNPNDIIVI